MFIRNDLNFSGIAALLAVIAFCVQLRIHDIIINILHYGQHRLQIVLHVGHFHIADRTARGERLKLCLKFQLFKSVDFLRHMHMVAVRDIVLVRHAGDNTEPFLQCLREFIGGGLQWRSVQAEINIGFLFPLFTCRIELFHHF